MQNEHEVIAKLRELIGKEALVSDWITVPQKEADIFAILTDDWALMHNDPEWAAKTPWGGTIVQAYHVMALFPSMLDILPIPRMDDDKNYALNYGLNRVRVMNVLRVGHPFRVHTEILEIKDKGDNRYLITLRHTVEIKDEEKPMMVAETLAYFAFDQDLFVDRQMEE
jgi:acyl dehydratase